MPDSLLQINNLHIDSKKSRIVEQVSFTIPKNSSVGLVGESGSGKSITALSILGLLPHGVKINKGEILFRTKKQVIPLESCSESYLQEIRSRNISMIFQEPMTSLNPSMRCGKQVLEARTRHHKKNKIQAKADVLELFREVKLPDPERIYNSWPHELSGGQKQRVMIAMALINSPDLIIADEPTTALDVTVQKKILELLLSLKERFKLSILLISHDLQLINQFCDHIVVMNNGSLIETGITKKVMDNPREPYTKGLLSCKPSLQSHPYRLPTIQNIIENQPAKKGLKPRYTYRNAEIVLSVKNLSVSFGRKKKINAVKNVGFDVYKGETLGIVGESGCGKTTLGRTILQLLQADTGNVLFKGVSLGSLRGESLRKIRNKIQIVFQDPYSSLNPGKTIGNIVSEPMVIHGSEPSKQSAHKAAQLLLEKVGIPAEAASRYPHEFSGGQRQRIGIARALACNPEFIILDESVSALDVSIQAQILNLLNDLKEEFNLTYMFISHDLTIVKYMSDRVIVLRNGEIVESGLSEELYKHPKEEYTKELLNAIPD